MKRRGSLVVEVAIAAVLLSVAMIGVSQLLAVAIRHQRAAEVRRAGIQAAANALEQTLVIPYGVLDQERLNSIAFSESEQSGLLDGQLRWKLEVAEGPIPAKQVTAEITWAASGSVRHRVELTAWRFPGRTNP